MSISLLHQDKIEVITLMEKLLEKLCFHKLPRPQVEATRMHLDAMRLEPRPMEIMCTLAADERGTTQMVIRCSFMEVGHVPTN